MVAVRGADYVSMMMNGRDVLPKYIDLQIALATGSGFGKKPENVLGYTWDGKPFLDPRKVNYDFTSISNEIAQRALKE